MQSNRSPRHWRWLRDLCQWTIALWKEKQRRKKWFVASHLRRQAYYSNQTIAFGADCTSAHQRLATWWFFLVAHMVCKWMIIGLSLLNGLCVMPLEKLCTHVSVTNSVTKQYNMVLAKAEKLMESSAMHWARGPVSWTLSSCRWREGNECFSSVPLVDYMGTLLWPLCPTMRLNFTWF